MLLPQGKEILISPISVVHPLMVENSITLAAWVVAGKPLRVKEFQKKTSDIITNSKPKGTLSNYESALRKWASWCLEQKIDPFQAPAKDILEYLTFLFNYDNKYRTINLHRLAISAFDECINGLPVGMVSLAFVYWYLVYLI